MEKLVRNGKVAVLVSRGYGAGWYSWNTDHPQLLFHPKLVEMVEAKRTKEISEEWIEENLGITDDSLYLGGKDTLVVYWVNEGTQFKIDEYDGAESLVENSDELWNIA